MPFASAPGANVHYTVAGEGPALVLLHGTGGDGFTHWGQLLAHLPGRRVICPDYAGSGQTTDGGGVLQLDDLVAQVLAVLDACGEQAVDLVGYSLGAVVATVIAAKHPERVRRLVLVAGFVGGEDGRSTLQFGLWQQLIAQDHALMARFLLLTGCHPDWLAAQPAERIARRLQAIVKHTDWAGMARQAELDGRLDIRPLLARVHAPTQVIVGSEDQMVPARQTDALVAGITGASRVSLPAGHLLPLEQPTALATTLLAFVDASSNAAASA